MRASLPARLLVAALAAFLVVPVGPAAPARAAEATTTTVASSANPSTYGGGVTFTATVSPAAAGSVTFSVGAVQLGDPVPVVAGQATSAAIADLAVGSHAVTAAFASDDPGAFDSSSGSLAGGQTVDPATLTVEPAPVTVAYGSPEPAYPFAVSGFVLGESEASAAGYSAPACDAAYTTTTPVASSPLEITCSGGSATSYTLWHATASLTITRADQSIAFTSTAPPGATVGETYTPTATATSGLAVAFTIDPASASVCSLGGGQVSLTGAGTCTILADQAGDGNWNPAAQVQQSFPVGRAATALALGSSTNPSTYGQGVTFTATVTPATASGTVTVGDGTTTLGTCALVAGACTVATGEIRAGTRSIVATYAGDADHADSVSSPLPQVVNPKTLTVTGITAADRVYDGTTAATIGTAGAALVGVLAGDSVTLVTAGVAGAFADRHVGTGKAVAVTGLGLAGDAAGNYALAQPTTTASITRRPIVVTAVASTKTYDGTTASSAIPTVSPGGVVAGDTATMWQAYDTTSAGSGKTLTPAITIFDGNDGDNYQVTAVPVTTGVIEPKTLTVTGITAADRVYDGTTAATIGTAGAALVGVLASDSVTLVTAGVAGAFADRHVGTGKAVAVTGLGLAGDDAGNYALAQPTATASITKALLTVRAGGSRPYGSPNPPLPLTYDGFVPGETVANAGITGSPVCTTTASTTSVVGSYPTTCTIGTLEAANYGFTAAPGVFTVTRAPLALTADPKSRQYGRTPDPAFTATVSGFVLGETAALLTGAPSCSTTVRVTDDVGAYAGAIACTPGTLSAPNYAFTGPNVRGTFTVVPAVAPPIVTSSANPAAAGSAVTFTASVAWPVGSPTGTVTFREGEGETDLSGPVVLVGGTARFTTSWPSAGPADGDVHDVVAVYSGDGGNFAPAAAVPFRQVIGRSPVEVVVSDAPATWETNVPVTFTAVVRPDATGVTTPVTGTVAFRVDGTLRGTVAVVDGRATYTTTLALGARKVEAAFTPDTATEGVFLPGVSAPLARTVVANTVNASGVGRSSSSVYPVRDGWKDTVEIRGTRNERLSVRIAIYSPTGSRVRSVSIAAGSGPYRYTWNGRNSSGSILAAGRYRVVQVLRDAYGASRSYTSYVTLSRRTMSWYTRTITVSAGPRRFSAPGDASIQAQYSTTSTRPLTLFRPDKDPEKRWLAVGYQFTLPSASTYTSVSFRVQGSWTGSTAPKIGLVPWSGGDWADAMYSPTRARAAMDTIATDWDAHTLTNLAGVRSGRYVRAAIDSFDPATGSGYGAEALRYTITGVRIVVKYGVLN